MPDSVIPKKDPTIKLHPVVSSNILGAGYDPATKTLEIKFSNGATYRYENVSQEVYDAMWKSDSIGKYVHDNIAKSYSYKKLK